MNTDKNNTQLPQSSVKCRFFAQYQFSHVCFEGISNSAWNTDVDCIKGYFVNNGDRGKIFMQDTIALQLKPLSKITNEDVIYCVELMGKKVFDGEINGFKETFIEAFINKEFYGTFYPYRVCEIVDYLRFKGYAIPFMNYSIDELISFGWVKLL